MSGWRGGLAGVVFASWMAIASPQLQASGTSPYLPLNLSPGIERKIERVMILAGSPQLTRPIAVDRVLMALPKARRRDPELCAQVQRYLERYFRSSGLTHAAASIAAASKKSDTTLPNQHGERVDSNWDASVEGYYRPAEHLLLSLGGAAYGGTDGRFNPTGSMLSFGNEYLQLDAGYRDHWFSPMTDSSMLQSTEAPTMPSLTVSNLRPISALGLEYQLFLARMSYSDKIAFNGGYTAGYPRLGGGHFAIEPVDGWNIAINRTFQFGGGARHASISDFIKAWYEPGKIDNTPNVDAQFSNEQASITSAFTFPGPTPLEAYFEYAGEDTFHGENVRLHETDISAGLHFPSLFKRFDLTLEVSEWQNAWYVHHIWQDGMTNDGEVTGNWGADWRTFGDPVGAQSAMAQLAWSLHSGDSINLRYRTLQNQHYYGESYDRAQMLSAEYAQPRSGYTRGLSLDLGRDEFGNNFVRLAAFARFDGGSLAAEDSASDEDDSADTGTDEEDRRARLERFVDVGIDTGKRGLDLLGFTAAAEAQPLQYRSVSSPHLGIGVRRAVSTHSDLGVRAEFDNFDGSMIALRALDYRYRWGAHLALGGFFGFARYAAPTPAQGYYAGVGLQWRNILPRWDLSLDWRYFDRLQRDKLLPSDPQNGDPVEAYTLNVRGLYLSRRF